jgi:hypothetical protein
VRSLSDAGSPAIDTATSRAHAMNSFTTGPSVRFFSITIPIGDR